MSIDYKHLESWRTQNNKQSYQQNEPGIIVSWTQLFVAPDNFSAQVPYFLAIIKHQDGSSTMCQIVDSEPHTIQSGASVQMVTRIITDPGKKSPIIYGKKAVVTSLSEQKQGILHEPT